MFIYQAYLDTKCMIFNHSKRQHWIDKFDGKIGIAYAEIFCMAFEEEEYLDILLSILVLKIMIYSTISS